MIGKAISTLLTGDAPLVALVGNNIFPYVIDPDTPLPAVVYTIDNVNPTYNKDGWATDDIEFSVMSFSKDYNTLQSVVSAIRAALEGEKGTVESIDLRRIDMTAMQEGFNITEDVFANKLTFSVTINDY